MTQSSVAYRIVPLPTILNSIHPLSLANTLQLGTTELTPIANMKTESK